MSWIYIFASFSVAALLTSLLNWLALDAFRRAPAAHWTERARLLWPVRMGVAWGMVSVMLSFLMLATTVLQVTPAIVLGLTLAGVAGAFLGAFVIERAAFPHHRFHHWLVFMLCILSIRGIPIFLWMQVGIRGAFGDPTWPAWLVAAFVAQCFLSFGLWLWPLRWLGLFEPGSDALVAIVRELSAAMQVPVRHVWETAPVTANALASPMWKAVIVTRETMAVLDPQELRSILAHELGHLAEPWRVTWLRILGTFWLLPLAAMPWMARFGFTGFVSTVTACLFWLRLARRLSRAEEHRADAAAAQAVGNGEVSARALEKLHEAALIPAVFRVAGMTHPPLYDRMLAAGVTPPYDRPRPPRRMALNGWLAIMLWLGAIVFQIAIWRAFPPDSPPDTPLLHEAP